MTTESAHVRENECKMLMVQAAPATITYVAARAIRISPPAKEKLNETDTAVAAPPNRKSYRHLPATESESEYLLSQYMFTKEF